MRIEPHQAPSACPSRHQRARNVVVIGRGVETQHGSFGDADVVARHDASQQRARRQAWPVDDDTLAGSTYLVELKYIGRDLPAGIIDDAHISRSRVRPKTRGDEHLRERAGKYRLQCHEHPLPI